MLQKLKEKITTIAIKSLALGLLGLVFFAVWAPLAQAAAYAPSGVQIQLNTYTPGASGGFQLNNLIQVGKDQSSATIQVEAIVTQPTAGLILGSDQLSLPVGTSGQTQQYPITALGAGADIMGTNATAGGVDCGNKTLGSLTYLSCNFKDSATIAQASTVAANTPVRASLTVNFSNYKLDPTNITSTQQIIVYPYLVFNNSGNQIFVNSAGGFPLYVQFYNTQTDANTAIANGTRPTNVPQYTGGTVSSPQTTAASSGGNIAITIIALIGKIIGGVVLILQEFVYAVFTFLLIPLLNGLLSIHPYTDLFVGVIYPGWVIVRNACNILFIVAIIAIAMGTLFRVESYQYKHLLVQLIIAALLVNFSLVIGQAVLDLADTMQNQFLPNTGDVTRSLGSILIKNRTSVENFGNMVQNAGASFSGVIAPLFDLALALGTFAVFAALDALLAVRVVALWILLMISPLAYVAGILPTTAHYRSEWWKNFIKYAFFGAIIGFFLNIAATLVVAQSQNPILTNISSAVQQDPNLAGHTDIATFMFSIGSNVLLLIFIFAALQVADKLGIYGGSAVTEIGKKGMLAPFAAAGSIARAAGNRSLEYASDKTRIELDPRVWNHELGEYLKKKKRDRQLAREERKIAGVPTGAPRDLLENYANWNGVKRMWKSGFGFSGHGKVMKGIPGLEDQANMLTDKEVADNMAAIKADGIQLGNLNHLKGNLEQDVVANNVAKNIKDSIDKKLVELNAEYSKQLAVRSALMRAGKPTSEIDGQIAAVYNKIHLMSGDSSEIDAQLASGAMDIDLKSVLHEPLEQYVKDNIYNKDQELAGLGTKIKETEADRNARNESLVRDSNLKNKYLGNYNANWDNNQQAQARKKLQDFRSLAEQVERPEAYYARAARLEREGEEAKKISQIHDEGELNKLLRNARRIGDKPKAIAIIKKLTRDRNWNEIMDDEGFSTDFNGARKFFEGGTNVYGEEKTGLKQDLKLSDHEMLELATEIGYEAEESKQYNIARLTWIDPDSGHLAWNGMDHHGHDSRHAAKNAKGENIQHMVHVLTEARKSEPRKRYGDLPRWCYVTEEIDAKGVRQTKEFEPQGMDLLLDACGNPKALDNVQSQGNTYSMKAITRVPKWKEKLVEAGASRGIEPDEVNKLISAIQIAAGKGT